MIKSFDGEYRFLSNFHEWPLLYRGIIYKSGEHAFQAAKATCKEDHDAVMNTGHPAQAKKMGRKIKIRLDWIDVKDNLMLEVVRCKFRDLTLREWLLNTGDEEMQEGNVWNDVYWGVDLKTGKGENRLGKILMQVRDEIKKEV